EWKSRVHIQHGNEVQLVRQTDDSPDQAPVGRVGGHDAVLVGANEGIRDVTEELVVIVQVASSARVDVAGVEGRAFTRPPTQHPEELAEGLSARVEQTQLGITAGELEWIHIELAVYLAALVSEAKQETGAELAVELHAPTQAVRDA